MEFWTRNTTNSYRLSPMEKLPQLSARYPGNPEARKTTHLNEPIRLLINRISAEWPPIHKQDWILDGSYRLASPSSFTDLLQHNLELLLNIHLNQKPINFSLLTKFQELEIALMDETFQWALYERFLNPGEGFNISAGLNLSRKNACNLRKYLSAYRSAGKEARKRAIFIGVERAPLEELVQLEKKSMVELKSSAVCGQKNGRISDVDPKLEGPNYIVLEDVVNRVCAPTDGEVYPLIFWTKNDKNDSTPTPEKIFGSTIYNSSKLLPSGVEFALDEFEWAELDAAELDVLQYLTVHNSPLNRDRLRTEGKMAKGPGPHAVFGKPYQPRVLPSAADDEEVADRIEFGEIQPLLEARNHAFLHGFLPEVASKFVEPAKRGGLINDLGSPRLSTFVAFVYSASPHLDADSTPSNGLVIHRPPGLNRNTYNFVYMSHRLLVELETDARWIWHAAADYHGTTSGDFTKDAPQMTMGFIKHNLMEGQWTRVSVIPKAVLGASMGNSKPKQIFS